MEEEKTLSSRLIYQGRVVSLRVDKVHVTDGETTREIVEHANCVAIIAIDTLDNVLLVRQFRKPVERSLLEIPAGSIDPSEDPEAAVGRELREETGYMPAKSERLGGFFSAPGVFTEYMYIYLATELTYSPLKAEDTASIELIRMPVGRIRELISSGEIIDAKSIAGLLTYLEHRLSSSHD